MADIRSKFAAQLYTVRDQLKTDFPGVLRELKKMGWAGVQISGLHGYDPAEIASVLQETGLETAGIHVPLEQLVNGLDQVVREAQLFRTRDVVCPYLTEDYRTDAGFREVRLLLSDIARQLATKNIRLSYHNHAFEFEVDIDGRSALEFILEPRGNESIYAEIDVYWVKKGGVDPTEFICGYANRMPIIHLKDMSNDGTESFAEIGTGSIDFHSIISWCERSGVEWYAVEQDVCKGDPLDSLRISLGNLNRLVDQMSP